MGNHQGRGVLTPFASVSPSTPPTPCLVWLHPRIMCSTAYSECDHSLWLMCDCQNAHMRCISLYNSSRTAWCAPSHESAPIIFCIGTGQLYTQARNGAANRASHPAIIHP